MGERRKIERRVRSLLVAAVLMAVTGSAMVSAQASSPSISASVTATSDLADGDRITITLRGIEDRHDVLLTQCVLATGVPEDRSCGRSSVAAPTPEGTAALVLTVRSQVGTHPDATCPPPEGGHCVLRVTQAEGTAASSRISSVRGTAEAADDDNGPPEGRRLVQDIGVTFLEPGTSTPAPDDTDVGGVVITPPTLPTAPVDERPRGEAPGTEVAGVGIEAPRTSMPVTGPSQTLVLAIAGLVLLQLGWVAVSATRSATHQARVQPST